MKDEVLDALGFVVFLAVVSIIVIAYVTPIAIAKSLPNWWREKFAS